LPAAKAESCPQELEDGGGGRCGVTLEAIATEMINRRGYLVICTEMNFPKLPYSLARGECENNGDVLDSSCLYAYERTTLVDYQEQVRMGESMGIAPTLPKADDGYFFYRVRAD
jgi:hypothetical protein